MKKIGVVISLCLLISVQCLGASAAVRPVVLGQIASGGAYLNGVSVPSGTTVLSSASIKSVSEPVSIHLATGQSVRLNRNSVVEFSQAGEGVEIAVTAGTLSYQGAAGSAVTVANSTVAFSQRREGAPVGQQAGVVATLASAVDSGASVITVNDSSQINPNKPILIRCNNIQEVRSIQTIQGTQVTLTAPLQNSYAAQCLVIQNDDEVAAALGTVVTGTVLTGTIAAGTIATTGIAAGVGAAIVGGAIAGGIIAGPATDEGAPASPIRP